MHININFILLQEFDVEYYFICFILILKFKFFSKMKWKCIFSEISPQSNPLRELITPPTKLAGPGGRPCRPTGGDCRVSRADYVSTQPYRVHSLDNAKTGEYRRYMCSLSRLRTTMLKGLHSDRSTLRLSYMFDARILDITEGWPVSRIFRHSVVGYHTHHHHLL